MVAVYDVYNKRTINKNICGALTAHGNASTTSCGTFFVIEDFYKNRNLRVYEEIAPTIRAEREGLKVMEEAKCVGGIGEKKSNGGTQYFQQDRVYNGDIALAMPSQLPGGSYKYLQGFRIRKLTPRECWRLMGYADDDFDKAAAVNSNTQLYKQAGNAIVKQVLMAIFSQMNIKGVTPWNKRK